MTQVRDLLPGDAAREWVTSDESMMSSRKMGENIIDGIEETFKKWTPRSTFDFIKIEDYITKLEKQNKELEATIEQLKKQIK